MATTRIIIVGGGFAGMELARTLEHLEVRSSQSAKVTLVDGRNHLCFSPLLAEVATGALEPRHAASPLRYLLPHTEVRMGQVTRLDPVRREVQMAQRESDRDLTIPYDHLVLCPGSTSEFSRIPGAHPHMFFSLKSISDALRLRNHLLALLESADDPDVSPEIRRRLTTIVVAGAGLSGTELAATIHELLHHQVARYYPRALQDGARVILVSPLDRIMPEVSPSLSEYTRNLLERRGLEIQLQTLVEGAQEQGPILQPSGLIPAATVIWTAGVQPSPLLDHLAPKSSREKGGRLPVEPTLCVEGIPGVWAAGDCAAILDPHTGKPYPPTAQHATRQGRHLARNLVASLEGEPLIPFVHRDRGRLVPIGRRRAVAEMKSGRNFKGLAAWWAWRAFYLWQFPGAVRKIRIGADWGLDLVFPRDITLIEEETCPRVEQNPEG